MALEAIAGVRGKGVYVPGDDIDTDRIIPARFMKCVTFEGLGEYLFYDVCHHEDGSAKAHPLNDERYAGATILLTGSNFGSGSSREHAPQALYRHGFRAVIAESFAEIFFGNSITLGMPCVTAEKGAIAEIASLLEKDPDLVIEIDIAKGVIAVADKHFEAKLPASAQTALLRGRWDPLAELLEGEEAITTTAARLPYLAGK
ncbi:MAG: 3-isopropylmalate dehydratase small subunit [Trueperaceae bacterium]|nr:MAG: 3-isopropylmalate dehydratase small subunit [Trueperaceae bacterium]